MDTIIRDAQTYTTCYRSKHSNGYARPTDPGTSPMLFKIPKRHNNMCKRPVLRPVMQFNHKNRRRYIDKHLTPVSSYIYASQLALHRLYRHPLFFCCCCALAFILI